MIHQEDDLQMCPYNPSHMIRPKRMITHLTKCRKNYLSLGYRICPMDATHHIPPDQYEEHLEKCPNRRVVDVDMFEQASAPANPIMPPEIVRSILVPTEENWDNDVAPPYNPKANAATRNVMRVLTNAPPAERKAFQAAERLRLIAIQAKGPSFENVVGTQDPETIRMPARESKAVLHAERLRLIALQAEGSSFENVVGTQDPETIRMPARESKAVLHARRQMQQPKAC